MEEAWGDAGLKLVESKAIFFDGPREFRAWLEANHGSETEVFVGYYKKATGKQTMSWSQAVDQALCFGWIDGVMQRIDDETHMQRFTPRKKGSNWSKVNVEKMARLQAEGLVAPAGRRAFAARSDEKTGIYSFEQDQPGELPPAFAERLRANEAAEAYFEARPPWYRRTCVHWVTSAKREDTRVKRMDQLIECSAQGLDVPQFRRRA